MKRGVEGATGWLRDRLGSVPVASALAALIVLGVMAVLIVTVRASRATLAAATETVAAAAVAEDAILATASLQRERALATALADPSLLLTHPQYGPSIEATDLAIKELRDSWAAHRGEIPETATPSIGDLLVAEVSLEDIRDAARSPSSTEPTFDLYDELVALATAATDELVKQPSDFATLSDRRLIVALLAVSNDMHTRRHVGQEALAAEPPVPDELLLRLDAVNDAVSQGFIAARSRAEVTDEQGTQNEMRQRIEDIRTGPLSVTVDEMVTAVLGADGSGLEVGARRWFAATSARIDQLEALVPEVIERVNVTAAIEQQRAERALWTNSLLLGSLFVLTTLLAINAVVATRERREALAEYGQLSDGLRQWFATTTFPSVENVQIAGRYVPASVRTRSGGDWYDVYRADDELALVIGDVAGHGPDATAHMAQLRNLLHGQSTARVLDPAAQVDLLDRTVSGSGMLATLTYGLLDVDKGRFTYTRAGHIPLLIRSAAGDVRIEEEGTGPPLGSGVTLPRATRTTQLYPGDVLILMTDGLVERVNRDIDLALDEISKELTEAGPTSEEMLDQLFEMREDSHADDAAALLVRWNESS
jgi:serine phosphatase RsbU (regulator of sigma subunit)